MSVQKKAMLKSLMILFWKSTLLVTHVILTSLQTLLYMTTVSSLWMYNKLEPLHLKIKESRDDTGSATSSES